MRKTEPYKRTLSGSIGAGMGSVFGPSGKQYFILEHKMSSKYHRAGESQEIIVDQIEIGRDPKCQVRFDESFQTVSRRHAAILRDGDKWKLVQLSSTNPTLLNGKPVHSEWYLQNGDEIQFAAGGPKLGFIIPTGNKSTVGSIGLSRRLSLFRQQALKPYKTAITVLSVALCLLLAGSVTFGIVSQQRHQTMLAESNRLGQALNESKANTDSLEKQLIETNKQLKEMTKQVDIVKGKLKNKPTTTTTNGGGKGVAPPIGEIEKCVPYVYAILQDKIVVTYPDGSVETYNEETPYVIGSGFLLADGRFVTARHVTESWFFLNYFDDEDLVLLNLMANNGGKVVAHYTAVSSSGQKLSFTSNQLTCNRRGDATETIITETGMSLIVKMAIADDSDWAYYQTGKTSGLNINNSVSSSLHIGSELEVLGFPRGRGAERLNQIHPIYSTCKVARDGLDVNGTIMVSNDNTEPGNSGGPVLFKHEGAYIVVGIVSGSNYQKGRMVPISAAI